MRLKFDLGVGVLLGIGAFIGLEATGKTDLILPEKDVASYVYDGKSMDVETFASLITTDTNVAGVQGDYTLDLHYQTDDVVPTYTRTQNYISKKGVEKIMEWERLRTRLYKDSGGVPTICYGHTGRHTAHQTRTPEQCYDILREDIQTAERAVNTLVSGSLEQNQYDALVSLVFNIGVGAFERSTVLEKINAGDFTSGALHFHDWMYVNKNVEKGLVNRRRAEIRTFLYADYQRKT
jgi:lysozyme